jgi:hypothetical protein
MKKFINKTAEGESLLLTLNAEFGSDQVITKSLEVTKTIITASDAGDIAVLNASSYEEYEPEYVSNRRAEYPSIDDLVVSLFDIDDRAAIDTKRAAVKVKYPKP